jgi:hypothetical protein
MSAPLAGASDERSVAAIDKATVIIILNKKGLIFGEIGSVADNYLNARDKFIVDHKQGSPQISTLLSKLKRWKKEEQRVAILAPEQNVPVAILVQTVQRLKASGYFQKVVLATNIL